MNGQALGLRKERKKKMDAQPILYKKIFLGSLERERDWTRIPWDSQKLGILGKCRKGLAGIVTVQGSMLMNTKNEDRHVLSAAHGSEKG